MKKSYTKSLSPVLRLFLSLLPITAPQPSSPSASPIHSTALQSTALRLNHKSQGLASILHALPLSAQRSSPQPSQTQLSATKMFHAQTCLAMPCHAKTNTLSPVLTDPQASALHKLLRSIVLRC